MDKNEIDKALVAMRGRYPSLTFDPAFSNFLELDGDEAQFKSKFFHHEMDSITYEQAISNYRLWYGLYLKLSE